MFFSELFVIYKCLSSKGKATFKREQCTLQISQRVKNQLVNGIVLFSTLQSLLNLSFDIIKDTEGKRYHQTIIRLRPTADVITLKIPAS